MKKMQISLSESQVEVVLDALRVYIHDLQYNRGYNDDDIDIFASLAVIKTIEGYWIPKNF